MPFPRQEMQLSTKGRRNALGSMAGPRNECNVSGTHGALAVATSVNTDVQISYRLPITETHSDLCQDASCIREATDADIIVAAQAAQDAQVC